MYPCSNEFHQAVQDGNPQKALLIFSDCVFTSDDINVENGIEFLDNFNLDTNLSIGQTPSNEIRFSLFNDDRLLNDYTFGQFIATIGVMLREETYVQRGTVTCIGQNGTYVAQNTRPYLIRNGQVMPYQPTYPLNSLLAYGGKLYGFGEDGYAIVYDESTQNVTQDRPNAFMKKKAETFWKYKGISYRDRILREWVSGTLTTWEFCPLGVFNAERPNVPNVIEIDFTCYDRMQEFEIDWPGSSALGISYPTTIGTIYSKMCDYLGVTYETADFINSDAEVEEEPDEFEDSTMRTVLGWIAEAAASNARFDRNGVLKMDWLKETSQSFDEGGYTEFKPYWYEAGSVDKLYNRDTSSGEDKTVGSGSNGYLIQDNPFLKGVS